MKLVININCYNEAETLPSVLRELPRALPGIEEIEIQVVDDGSTDDTVAVAMEQGALVLRHAQNRGLGAAFRTGLSAALARGADILVNTDGDGQYPAEQIAALIAPILAGKADLVIGDRKPWMVEHFSLLKRALQWLGSHSVRRLIGTPVQDVVSGFRAYSAEAMLRLNPLMDFSYVLDTLAQATHQGLRVAAVPIQVRPATRPSRLYRTLGSYLLRSARDVFWVHLLYAPRTTALQMAFLWAAVGGMAAGVLAGKSGRVLVAALISGAGGAVAAFTLRAIFLRCSQDKLKQHSYARRRADWLAARAEHPRFQGVESSSKIP